MSARTTTWLAEQAAQREAPGLTRSLRDSDRGEPLLDLAGNDYLGLARDPRVVAAAMKAARPRWYQEPVLRGWFPGRCHCTPSSRTTCQSSSGSRPRW